MMRLVAGMVIGAFIAILVIEGYFALNSRAPVPTSQLVNQPTRARQIRVLRLGTDPDFGYFKLQHEKH